MNSLEFLKAMELTLASAGFVKSENVLSLWFTDPKIATPPYISSRGFSFVRYVGNGEVGQFIPHGSNHSVGKIFIRNVP